VKRFKSLADTGPVAIAPLTVLFGPNAAGKSNFLDAVQVLSRLASERTLADALGEPIRGLPLEAFSFPSEGLPGLLASEKASFELEADVESGDMILRYRVEVAIQPESGTLTVEDEYLATLDKKGEPKGDARIEKVGDKLRIRRKSKPGKPNYERVGLGYTQLSDRRFSGAEYRAIERAREELSSWRTYYLDPRVAMRSPQAPQEVSDIGPLGQHVAPFLYRLRKEKEKVFAAVKRTLRTLIPSVEDLSVDLDPKRGVLDVQIRQDGTSYSSRIVSEGTLRVLALACVATNPWGGELVAFEEPENGVHPRRVELVARMLAWLATEAPRRQVLITTHSPLFCGAAIRHAKAQPDEILLLNVFRDDHSTEIRKLDLTSPLFTDAEIARGLAAPSEDGIFEGLVLRGWLDG
jgi:predicted ATPase